MEEKRNNSNNPAETQPMDEKGRYASKDGALSVSSYDKEGITFDVLEELGEVSEEFSMEGLEELGELPEEFQEKKSERFAFDYDSANIFGMSQEQAQKEADDLVKAINSSGSWAVVSPKFVSFFEDKRSARACLLALKKVLDDFPQLSKLLKNKIEVGTAMGKGKSAIVWGDAHWKGKVEKADWDSSAFQVSFYPDGIRMFGHNKGEPCPCTGTTGAFAKSFQSSTMHDKTSTPEEAVLSTMFHECGHVISYEIASRELGTFLAYAKKDCMQKIREKMSDIRDKVIDKALEEDPSLYRKDIILDTSAYGKSNVNEWFAETFASLYTKNPRKSALAMKKYLEEVYK